MLCSLPSLFPGRDNVVAVNVVWFYLLPPIANPSMGFQSIPLVHVFGVRFYLRSTVYGPIPISRKRPGPAGLGKWQASKLELRLGLVSATSHDGSRYSGNGLVCGDAFFSGFVCLTKPSSAPSPKAPISGRETVCPPELPHWILSHCLYYGTVNVSGAPGTIDGTLVAHDAGSGISRVELVR